MDGKMGVGKIENYRSGMRGGYKDAVTNGARDCGVVDSCSPFYRSYLRAVRWLAEQCEQFFDEQLNYGVDRFIKDIMMAKIVPNNEDYVVLGPMGERHQIAPIWLEEKTARLIREVQHDFDSKNDSKYFGQFRTPCGRTLDQVRSQFYVDCYSESVQPHSHRNLKANTTECVPVPSSEHVAEIVGKKGGKIKNIRAETSTYIKTPKRDEEPVFVITGRKEDVAMAKAKILAAAEHFTQLREARRQNPSSGSPILGPPRRDGDVTVPVEVPYEFVGLVVGQKGATIKRIQQDTGTYITTPSRRHRPIFEVVGQPGDVERAREAIQLHINTRVEKFREEAAMGVASGAEAVRADHSSLLFSERPDVDEFGLLSGCSDPFSSLNDANLGGTWTGVPPPSLPAPPPMQRYGAPPPYAAASSAALSGGGGGRLSPPGGSRLSAFRNLSTDGLDALQSAFQGLELDVERRPDTHRWAQSSVDASWRHASPQESTPAVGVGGWQQQELASLSSWLDARGRAASLPAPTADPARPPAPSPRRGSSDHQTRTIESMLLRSGALGWDAPLQLRAKGSNETLNSDSGVDATTPPPLDSTAFGPIGSKRTSPTLLLLSD